MKESLSLNLCESKAPAVVFLDYQFHAAPADGVHRVDTYAVDRPDTSLFHEFDYRHPSLFFVVARIYVSEWIVLVGKVMV